MGCGDSVWNVLLHEFAHLIRQDMGHPTDSVLATNANPPIDAWSARHVWNGDMDGVNWTVYPASPMRIGYEEIDWSGAVVATANPNQGTATGEYGNFVASIGPGQNGSAYVRASATARNDAYPDSARVVFFERTNGSNLSAWIDRRYIVSAAGGVAAQIRHHTCVAASTTSPDVYVVFTASAEATQASSGSSVWAGTREVAFAESHDNGNTWSAAAAIPGAFTRSGVSCAFDRATGRIVVGYSGSGEEAIWTTHRLATAVGPSAWAPVTRIDKFPDPGGEMARGASVTAAAESVSGLNSWSGSGCELPSHEPYRADVNPRTSV